MIKNVKNTVPWAYVINDVNGEKILRKFYEKIKKERKKVINYI